MTIDDQFEYEPFRTSARYYTGFDKRLSGNVIHGDKTEIVFDKSTFGLVNLKILDINSQSFNKEVTFYDGKARLYATLKTKDGNYKVSVSNTVFNFTVGDDVYPVNFTDGYAEVQIDAKVGNSIVKVIPADLH